MFFRHRPNEVELLFQILRIFTIRTIPDFHFLSKFLDDITKVRFLGLFKKPLSALVLCRQASTQLVKKSNLASAENMGPHCRIDRQKSSIKNKRFNQYQYCNAASHSLVRPNLIFRQSEIAACSQRTLGNNGYLNHPLATINV